MRERMGDLPVCVEFRAPGWLGPDDRDRTLAQLRDLGLALVVRRRARASKLRTVLEVTNDRLAVVRFHGRDSERWDAKNTERRGAVPLPLRPPPAADVGPEGAASWPRGRRRCTS